MKTTVLSLLFILTLCGCEKARERTAEELLASPGMEDEIYTAILNDNMHVSRLMGRMMADSNCRKMMEQDKAMVRLICMSDKMDTLLVTDQQLMESITGKMIRRMEADSAVCDKTCTQMMKSDPLKKYFGKGRAGTGH